MNLLVLAFAPLLCQDEHPPRLQPDPVAKPHQAWAWTSENGLRYTWVLPEGYEKEKPRHLVVICHGTGLDYRWGHSNYKPGRFRPEDIVVSVDGPTEAEDHTRLFMGEEDDAAAIRDFLAEMRRSFAVDRVFLYGHSQGGFFVVYYAGLHPGTVDGVVAHASGAWNWSKTEGGVQKLPTVFLHGTGDPVVPYRQSPGSRNVYLQAGCEHVGLRRMQGYNHWPNAVRASECVDWCLGLRTEDAAEALEAARRIAAPKPPDEYQYGVPPPLGLAREVLRRFEKGGSNPLKKVPSKTAQEAKALAKRIDQHAEEQVAELSKLLPKGGRLQLDSSGWVGTIAALREDLRGLDAVEKLVKKLDYDDLVAKHAEAAQPIFAAWHADPFDDATAYSAALETLPDCFLYEGLPSNFLKKIKEIHQYAENLELADAVLGRYELVRQWESAWLDGYDRYELVCGRWRSAWK